MTQAGEEGGAGTKLDLKGVRFAQPRRGERRRCSKMWLYQIFQGHDGPRNGTCDERLNPGGGAPANLS